MGCAVVAMFSVVVDVAVVVTLFVVKDTISDGDV